MERLRAASCPVQSAVGSGPGRAQVEAGADLVDEGLDKVGLAAHVGVEGVGGDPAPVGQAAHGQCPRAVLVEQGQRLLDDQLAGQEASLPGPGHAHRLRLLTAGPWRRRPERALARVPDLPFRVR